MKNLWRNLHLWVSVPFGIIISLICLSGALLVFEKEITESGCASAAQVKPQGQPLPLDAIISSAASSLPADAAISGVEISPDPKDAYRISLAGKGHKAAFADQYTGEITGKTERTAFFKTIRSLHGSLLCKRTAENGKIAWGPLIVGISTLLLLFALMTGIAVWWPKNREALRRSLTITGKHGMQRFWFSLHDAGGIYTVIILSAMCITGLTWSFEWFNRGFYTLLGASEQIEASKPNKGTAEEAAVDYSTWQKAYAQVAKENPDRRITVRDGSISVSLGTYGNPRAADTYKFDTSTGEITGINAYADSGRRTKISGWVGALHTGTWGGLFSKTLYFLAALMGASLPLTGYYIWLRRIAGRRIAGVRQAGTSNT